ncbi:MAG: HEAT repeat domain-containing protein, partial [Pyrinomonadaceae bacterium]
AELLAALAGRNPQRRERAGTAFVKEGYFDETARDLREADAPAERAAAARSLALLGDRSATPHLVAALEDQNLDVRRAAVEALGSLRDPVAVEPLEALLERERNERNRIPPRVIRVAADACREAAEIAAAPEPVAETTQIAETAIEPAPFVEFVRPGVKVKPREEAATVEAAPSPEVAAPEPVEESPVSIAPFVGEREQEEPAPLAETFVEAQAEPSNAVEPVFVEDARADEEEVTLVAEAPAHETGVDPFVADLTEELNAAAETQTFETAVAEPEAVADTGVEPFVDTDEYAVEVSRPAAESTQSTLFDEGADKEVTREVAPLRPAASAAPEPPSTDAASGEWFDFDMRELSAEPRAATPEPTPAPPTAQEHVFETSSGDTLTSRVAPAVDLPSAATEPPSFADERAEMTREVETFGARAPEREAAAPASSAEKGLAPFDEHSSVPASIQQRLASEDAGERAAAIIELSRVDTDEAFQQICAGFDDGSKDVRGAAARALYGLRTDRADSFTRALREASPERRRQIGAAISSSGLAGESISQLTGESREKTYEAFSLLFLMAKAGEVQPLVRAIEGHPSNEVRLAVVKLLALSGQKEILPAFRRLAVRGSLPTEVRSAVMEAIYQISSSQPTPA